MQEQLAQYISARPGGQADRLREQFASSSHAVGVRRALAWADNQLRQCIRWVALRGLGKNDTYEGSAK
jgi:hypothetical protein